MTILPSDKLSDHIGSFIHQETQEHENHYDLTIARIYQLTEAGSLDFGGSEFKAAQKCQIKPQKKDKSDDYGWWHLPKGTYQATMNENITELTDSIAIITLHNHAHQAGIISNTSLLSDYKEAQPLTIIFQIPEVGCNIKENARLASIFILSS